MIGCGDGDGVNIFVLEELADIDVGFGVWQALLLELAEALVQHVFIHIAQSGKLCSRDTRKPVDVIVAATAHSANCHSDAIIGAKDPASQRKRSSAHGYSCSSR